MSERYSRLFTLPENLYAVGSPVVIAAGALLKDNQTGKVIAQLKLRNISKKKIKAATVSITPFDIIGNHLGESIRYQYLDLNALRDDDFGSKSAIFLPDITTRSFSATVTEIVFADNSLWSANTSPWEPLSVPVTISSVHGTEFATQFCIEYGADCQYFPISEKDLWRCACGTLNHQQECLCHSCGQSFDVISRFDVGELNTRKNQRLAAEKETAKNKKRQSRVKAIRIVGIVSIFICIFFAVWMYNRPTQVKLVAFNRFSGNVSTIASSIPKSGDYLHFYFTFSGPLNGKTHTLRPRVQWPGEDAKLYDWAWEDVQASDVRSAEWSDGYSSKKSGILVIEILDDETGEVLGRFEIEVK